MSSPDPFGGMPFFGDLAKMIGRQGPIAWDAARQIAHSIATDGEPEPNVDPLARIQLEQLARVAELQIANASGLDPSHHGAGITVTPVTRTQWVSRTLDDHRRLFESLAQSLGSTGTDAPPGSAGGHPAGVDPTDIDPLDEDAATAWLGQLMGMLQPMTLGMPAGSMVGHLATRSFGQ